MSRKILGMGRIRIAWMVLREAKEMMAEEEEVDREDIAAVINNREADPTSYDIVVQAVGAPGDARDRADLPGSRARRQRAARGSRRRARD